MNKKEKLAKFFQEYNIFCLANNLEINALNVLSQANYSLCCSFKNKKEGAQNVGKNF